MAVPRSPSIRGTCDGAGGFARAIPIYCLLLRSQLFRRHFAHRARRIPSTSSARAILQSARGQSTAADRTSRRVPGPPMALLQQGGRECAPPQAGAMVAASERVRQIYSKRSQLKGLRGLRHAIHPS